MPIMKITVTFTVPDAGLHVLKRCACLLERPFYGFLKSLVERQARWAPPGERIEKLDLGVEIETSRLLTPTAYLVVPVSGVRNLRD